MDFGLGLTMRGILKSTYVAGFVALSLTLTGLALAPVANAGRFHVYACRTPLGEAAPANGWSGVAWASYADDLRR